MLPTILPCLQTLRFDFYLAVSRRGIVYYMRMILSEKNYYNKYGVKVSQNDKSHHIYKEKKQ